MESLFNMLLNYESIYLSSRPGMGDTTLIVNLAVTYLKSIANKNVAIFAYNFESSHGITASDAYGARFRAYEFEEELYHLIKATKSQEFTDKKIPQNDRIVYFDGRGFTPNDIEEKISQTNDIGFVFLDAPIFSVDNNTSYPAIPATYDEIAKMLQWFKARDIKVVWANSLCRGVEKRIRPLPRRSDFIKEHKLFDITVSIYRAEYYLYDNFIKIHTDKGWRKIANKLDQACCPKREEIRIFHHGKRRAQVVPVSFDFGHQRVTEK